MLYITIVLKSDEILAKDRLPFLELPIKNSMKDMKQSMYSRCVLLSPKSFKFYTPPTSSIVAALADYII